MSAKPYELVLKGFDGATDETDGFIFWVKTELSKTELCDWLTVNGLCEEFDMALITDLPSDINDTLDGLDWRVPEQLVEIRASIAECKRLYLNQQQEKAYANGARC